MRIAKSLTQEQLARIMGVTRSAISFYEAGQREPSYEQLKLLADYYNVSTDYLLGNDSHESSQRNESIFAKYRESENSFRIPVLTSVAGDIPIETSQGAEDFEYISSSIGDPRDYFAIHVHGCSMEPRLMDGDTIIVKKQDDLVIGQVAIAVVLISENKETVKQVRKTEKGMLLIGFNQKAYVPQFYTNEEIRQLPIRIAGVVIESRHRW